MENNKTRSIQLSMLSQIVADNQVFRLMKKI